MREDTGSMQWEERTCEIHGDRAIDECRLCGQEFCGLCSGGRGVCPNCLELDDADGADEDVDLGLDDEDGATKAD